jgi:hypothetical protein
MNTIKTSSAYSVTLSSDETKAFVVDGRYGLVIIDISDPLNLSIINTLKTSYTQSVTLSSDETKAFVADYYDGLVIIDISDPLNLSIINTIKTSSAYGVTLSSDETKAFVADGSGGLKIIDIEDIIKSPTIYPAVFSVDENSPAETFVGQLHMLNDENISYIVLSGQGSENFKVYDNGTIVVSSNANLNYESVQSYTIILAAYNEFGKGNNAAVQININNMPDVLPLLQNASFSIDENSIADTFVGQLSISRGDSNITSITLSGDGAENFKAYSNGTIVVANEAKLDNENKTSYILTAIAHNKYGASNNAVVRISINDLPDTPPLLIGTYININGSIPAYTTIGTVNIASTNHAAITDFIIGDNDTFGIRTNGEIYTKDSLSNNFYKTSVYANTEFGDSNIAQITILNKTNGLFMNSIYTININNIALSSDNTKLFVSTSFGGLKIFDVSNSAKPVLAGSVDNINYIRDIALSTDNTKIFIGTSNGLQIFDVNNPVNPIFVGSIDNINYIWDIALSTDNTKIFIGTEDRLQIFDINNPANPVPMGSIDNVNSIRDIALSTDNTKVFVGTYNNGLKIVDVSNPAKPVLIDSFEYTGEILDIVLSTDNTKAFVIIGGSLKIIDISIYTNIHSDMNGLKPELYMSAFNIDENSVPNTTLGKIFLYQGGSDIVSINLAGIGSENFKIYNNGTIVVNEGADLDYETNKVYILKAVATNSYGVSNKVDIYININDIPDTPPFFEDFTQYYWISEHAQTGDILGSLIINNIFANITSIELSGDGAENFKVYNNGTIVVSENTNLNYETKSSYALSVTAKNIFGTSNAGSIIIFIEDMSENTPLISLWPTWSSIDENSDDGTYVMKADIVSYDAPLEAVYLQGAGHENFHIALDGTITVANGADFDYETKQYYELQIFALNKYGKSKGMDISIGLNNIPDSPPVLSDTIIYINKSLLHGDYAGHINIYDDGSGIDDISLFGEGSSDFDISVDGSIYVSNGANFDNIGIYKIHVTASNEFGISNNATVWVVAKDNASGTFEFDNITFASFGSEFNEDDYIGLMHPTLRVECEITEVFTSDNDKIGISYGGNEIELYAKEFIQSGSVEQLSFYANSTCGMSNTAHITVDTVNRTTIFELPSEFDYSNIGMALIDNGTKMFINGYEPNSTYIVDMSDTTKSRYVNLSLHNSKKLSSLTLSDKKYIYLLSYGDSNSYDLNIYDTSFGNMAFVSSLDLGNIEEHYAKIQISKEGDKIFLKDYNAVRVIDISNPYTPSLLNTITHEGALSTFISKDEKTLHVREFDNYVGSGIIKRYDISNPVNPKSMTSLSLYGVEYIVDVSMDGGFVYGIGNEHSLVTYNTTDLNNPKLIDVYNAGSFMVEYMYPPVALNNSRILMGSKMESDIFTIYDFSNRTKPRMSVKLAGYLYFASDFTLSADRTKIFATSYDDGLIMIDVGDLTR